MSRKSPCYKCEFRSVYCHETCNCYAEFRLGIEQENRRKEQDKVVNQYMCERKITNKRNYSRPCNYRRRNDDA